MVGNVTCRQLLQSWKYLVDDMDYYKLYTKITYVNSFSRGFNSKISHGLFLTNSQENRFS